MFSVELAIKFGSNEIIIYRKGFGIIAKEPAYIATTQSGKNVSIKATGKKAEMFYLSHTKDVKVEQPIVNSEIVNEHMATLLLTNIFKEVIQDKALFTNIKALVAVPCALNEKQLVLLKKVLHASGVNKVTFVQNSVCAYEHMDFDSTSHVMVVDIGKYITDISVLNEFSFDFGRMYFLGGADMDKSLATFIKDNYNISATPMQCEKIKNELASLYERDLNKMEVSGMDENSKLIKLPITANEVRVSIINIYNTILKMCKDIIETLPTDLKQEIYNNGIMFVGGASAIPGLYEYASKQLEIPIIIPEEPMDAVILGAGKLLSSEKDFIKINL